MGQSFLSNKCLRMFCTYDSLLLISICIYVYFVWMCWLNDHGMSSQWGQKCQQITQTFHYINTEVKSLSLSPLSDTHDFLLNNKIDNICIFWHFCACHLSVHISINGLFIEQLPEKHLHFNLSNAAVTFKFSQSHQTWQETVKLHKDHYHSNCVNPCLLQFWMAHVHFLDHDAQDIYKNQRAVFLTAAADAVTESNTGLQSQWCSCFAMLQHLPPCPICHQLKAAT